VTLLRGDVILSEPNQMAAMPYPTEEENLEKR
jgi:hypothetical protein